MRISATNTTREALHEIGARLQALRLQQNMTAAQLATQAGVSLRTVNRAEAGENVSLETVIRLLRAADRLNALDAFLPTALVSPLQLAALRGHERRRASAPRKKSETAAPPAPTDGRSSASN